MVKRRSLRTTVIESATTRVIATGTMATGKIAAGVVMAKFVVVIQIAAGLATSGQVAVLKLLKIPVLTAVIAKIAVVLLADAAGVRDEHTKRSSPRL